MLELNGSDILQDWIFALLEVLNSYSFVHQVGQKRNKWHIPLPMHMSEQSNSEISKKKNFSNKVTCVGVLNVIFFSTFYNLHQVICLYQISKKAFFYVFFNYVRPSHFHHHFKTFVSSTRTSSYVFPNRYNIAFWLIAYAN